MKNSDNVATRPPPRMTFRFFHAYYTTFVVLLRGLGVVNMLKSAAIMISAALITGGILNLAL